MINLNKKGYKGQIYVSKCRFSSESFHESNRKTTFKVGSGAHMTASAAESNCQKHAIVIFEKHSSRKCIRFIALTLA